MPELDGFELAQMIREHPRFQETAIIFIRAIHLSELDSLKGYEMGGVDYVPVPVVPGVLRAKVRVFVDLYRKKQELARANETLEQRVAERTAELEAAIARQELLAREVDHRARNALAVIQSIVSMMPATPSGDFQRAVDGRIRAMARAHTLLSQTRWQGADLTRLVNEELEPYRDQQRVSIDGPAVMIKPTVAQNLALAIHELATNAAKYGALSAPDGRLSVSWVLDGDILSFEWSERASLRIEEPAKQGFGRKVIEASVKVQLGGDIAYEWRRDGLLCALKLPSEHFTPPAPFAALKPAHARESAEVLSGPSPIAGRHILIVEDEPLVAMMMVRLLEDLGATAIGPFSCLGEASENLGEHLDAALLDVNLAGTLVYPLAEELTRRGTPIVFLTGYESDSIDPRFTAPVLTKPIEAAELAEILGAVIGTSAAADRAMAG